MPIKFTCILLCLLICSSHYSRIKSESTSPDFTFTCFQNKNQSWGYDILISGKLFIHQPTIPAISGQKGFADKQSAIKIAKLTIKKLNHHPGEFPSISLEELKKLKILI